MTYKKSGFTLEETIREKNNHSETTLYLQSNKISRSMKFMLNEGITSIRINSQYGFNEKEIHFLSEWDFIEKVEIETAGLKIVGLHNLTNLESLFISGSLKQKIDFVNFPKLNFCNINFSEKVINLTSCSELEILFLWKFPFSDLNLLKTLNSIKELQLFDSKIENLSGIQNLQNLEVAKIERAKFLVSIDDLGNCSNKLEHLAIRNCKNLSDYSAISYLQGLKELFLVDSGDSNTLNFLPIKNSIEYGYIDIKILDGDTHRLLNYPIIFKNYKHYSDKNIYKLDPQADGTTKLVRRPSKGK